MASATADRARRLMALLRHLEPDSEIELERLAGLVGSSPEVVAEDIGTLSMCGVAPYDPLNLVSAFVDDGRVITMGPPPALDRPLRLSATEAGALVAALQAAGFGAGDALMERLAQASSLEFSADDLAARLGAETGHRATDTYERLAAGVAESRTVTIEYQRFGGSSVETRTIEPLSIFNDRGVWYIDAFCRKAEGARTFRIDRIRSADIGDEVFDRRPSGEAPIAFSGARLPKARLRFDDTSAYSQREWPSSEVVDADEAGGLVVEVPYSGTEWVARQVCARLGAVTVISPAEVRTAVSHMADTIAVELAGGD